VILCGPAQDRKKLLSLASEELSEELNEIPGKKVKLKAASNDGLAIVVMAAGKGKRMGGQSAKVMYKTGSRTLISRVLQAASNLKPEKTVVVTGFMRESVEEHIKSELSEGKLKFSNLCFALQKEPLGTGDAVKAALPELEGFCGTVVILSGDVPLVRPETLQELISEHSASTATLTVLTALMSRPGSLGRIIRDEKNGEILSIKEARDASSLELRINECNSGIYAVDSSFLKPALEGLTNNNAQKEYYLTDIFERAQKEGQKTTALILPNEDEIKGANNPVELFELQQIVKNRHLAELVVKGVIIEDMSSTFIDEDCDISSGVHIGPFCQILGKSCLGANVKIEGGALIRDSIVGQGSVIKLNCRLENAVVGSGCSVGPFAHLRPQSILKDEARIGNFVEMKNSVLGAGAKANHLTYLGDAEVGEGSNIGAGAITCNYDGKTKHKTVLGKEVFIGSNSSLVAPVSIGNGAIVGAGSVITKKIDDNALALTRAQLVIKKDWTKKK
jgi:bifunctional UDP-N-acetylglucosamine pyrophosphorylase/glucosamine-1-phosphate N-acetyltransferase